MRLRQPATVVFGTGSLDELPRLLRELGVARPLIATDAGVAAAGIAAEVGRQLAAAGLPASCWDGAARDPAEAHAERCAAHAATAACDGIVALGGGSVIDTAKVAAVLITNGGRARDYFGFDRARRRGLPLIAVPTVPGSGAEVSSHAVLLGQHSRRKEVVAGLHLLAAAALVDPALIATLPARQALWPALDSLVHAIEAFVARRATPATDALVRLALPEIAGSLPGLQDGSQATDVGRLTLCRGCLLAGLAMANAGAGAIHALGYPLSTGYGIPHGLANALMAPAALAHLWPARAGRYRQLARVLGGNAAADLAGRVRALLDAAGVRDTLADWGVRQSDLPRLAAEALHFGPVLKNTPSTLRTEDLLAIYRAAAAGQAPARPTATVGLTPARQGRRGTAAVRGA